jgi:DNA polymerase III epsilon subunit-like protein
MYNDLMLDLETMGTKSYSAIVSLAAVPFNMETGQVSDKFFYQVVELQSCLDLNLRINADTLYWWLSKDKEAQQHISGGFKKPLKEVLELFNRFFMESLTDPGKATVWGNSAKFDCGILENCYQVAKLKQPWNTWEEADHRTMVNKYGQDIKKSIKFEGIKHYPVDDCKYQIKVLTAIHSRIARGMQALKNERMSESLATKPE